MHEEARAKEVVGILPDGPESGIGFKRLQLLMTSEKIEEKKKKLPGLMSLDFCCDGWTVEGRNLVQTA